MNDSEPTTSFDVAWCREQFPALERRIGDRPAVFFDGPAGSQVPHGVIDAVTRYYVEHNANAGGSFATSRETDAMLLEARRTVADFLGAGDPDAIAFGPNMTTLCLSLSRALARTWQPSDEVIVTRLDHDANVTPWVRAAADAGATVRRVAVDPQHCTLDLNDFRRQLNNRTRLVAVGCASNATGTANPIRWIVDAAHEVGALVFLDAVHYAPHAAIDVTGWGCDLLACSAYKFFGPHVGILWGRRPLLDELPVYKLRASPDGSPWRWMTGTQNHEGIAGTMAAIEYLAEVGRHTARRDLTRREALLGAYDAIGTYERDLLGRLMRGLVEMPSFHVWGITDPERFAERMPTVALTHSRYRAAEMSARLGEAGIFTWHGHFYALPLTETLGLEPHGLLRIGLLHYNTAAEVDRLLECLSQFD